MFLLSLSTNKDSYNTQIIQCVNETIFRKRFRIPGFGTGSGTLEPVPWTYVYLQQREKIIRLITDWDHVLLRSFIKDPKHMG